MYEAFFGLTGKPFQLNPDPAFFYGSRGHKRAFAYLQYGVHQGEGFIIITGDVGAGKTTLVRSLIEQIDPNQFVAAQLVTTQLDAEDLLRAVAMAFGLPTKALDKAQLLAELEAFLVSLVAQGKRALLIVDEAQNLSARAIEELRMLSNFQLGNQGLLQSFLVGQPELRQLMQGPQLQQLRQRVTASYHLGPMDRAETQAYVEHRLRHVGWSNDPRFEPGAFDAIYTFSGGIPRRINTLCNRLLLAAALSEEHSFTAASVDATADEIRLELSAGSSSAAAAAARADGNGFGEGEPAIGLEERVVRLERAMTATLDLLQQMRRSQSPLKPLDPLKGLMDELAPTLGPIICVVGARPNYMKMAPLIRAFRSAPAGAAYAARAYRSALRRGDERSAVRRPEAALAGRQPRRRLGNPCATDRGDHAPLRACRRRREPELRGRRRGRELDAGMQPGSREEGDSGRPCRGGSAQLRSLDAGRSQPPAHRPDLRPPLHDRARRGRESAPRRHRHGAGPFRGQRHDRLAARRVFAMPFRPLRCSPTAGWIRRLLAGRTRFRSGHAASPVERRPAGEPRRSAGDSRGDRPRAAAGLAAAPAHARQHRPLRAVASGGRTAHDRCSRPRVIWRRSA